MRSRNLAKTLSAILLVAALLSVESCVSAPKKLTTTPPEPILEPTTEPTPPAKPILEATPEPTPPPEPPVVEPQAPIVVPPPPEVVDPKIEAIRLVQQLLAKGAADEAASRLAELISDYPDDPALPMLRAGALASAGRFPEARTALDDIIASRPADLDALDMAVRIARFQGDAKGRKAYLEAALKVAPLDARVLVGWGQLWLEGSSWAQAEKSFRSAIESDSQNAEAEHGLGLALYKLGNYGDATKALDAALALEPKNAVLWADHSRARYQLGYIKEAESDLGKSIELDPGSAWSWFDRGKLRYDDGRLEEAERDLDAAIERQPDYFLSYIYRGAIYERTERDLAAMADYDRVIVTNKDYWYAYESAGLCAFRLGRWAEAADRFQKAWPHARTRYDYATMAAIALFRDGKTAVAKAWASKIAAGIDRNKYQQQWLVLRLLADMNDITGELEVAIQNEKKLDLKASMLFGLGEYWLIRGKPDLCLKYLVLDRSLNRQHNLEFGLLDNELKRLGKDG
ncbi:MAG: tetratricopeptide repeat protein [Spirochaetota bacterium]